MIQQSPQVSNLSPSANSNINLIWSSEAKTASVSSVSDNAISVKIDPRFFEEVLNLSRGLDFSLILGLNWLIQHEIQHAELGHFELLGGVPTLNLIARSKRQSEAIGKLPKDIWHLVSPCIELQADHDAIDLMLGEYGIEGGDDIRTIAASIAAVLVLIECEDTKNGIKHSTHPKAATRIFQLLGHITEMWAHPAHDKARASSNAHIDEHALPSDEQIISFGKEVILPAYWDAVALAEAADAQSIIDDLGSSEDFFADIRYAKLGQWDQLKTVGAKEWATLKDANSDILAAMGY